MFTDTQVIGLILLGLLVLVVGFTLLPHGRKPRRKY